MSSPRTVRVAAPVAPVIRAAREDAMQVTQALFGEELEVLDEHGAWLMCRMRRDGYEGFAQTALLAPAPEEPATHTPAIPQTLIFPAADLKSAPARPLYMGARLRVTGREGRFSKLSQGGYVITSHLRPLSASAPDAASVAEMFLHAPYLWGGCSVAGIDCSGLVQMALRMAGHKNVPRDSGDQEKQTGAPLPVELATRGGRPGRVDEMNKTGIFRDVRAKIHASLRRNSSAISRNDVCICSRTARNKTFWAFRPHGLRRGDLVFWKGHVAMMLDEERIIHANGYHMRVAIEPLRAAMERIKASGGGPVTSLRRP